MHRPHHQRMTFAFFTDRQQATAESPFTFWPQHMTLFPPIVGDPSMGKSAIEAVVQNPTYGFEFALGSESNLSGQRVRILEGHGDRLAKALHKRLMDALVSSHVNIEGHEYIGEEYTPHVSIKLGQPELTEGDRFKLDHIALVTCEPDHNGEPASPQTIATIINLKQ